MRSGADSGEPERVFSLDEIMLHWPPSAGPSSARLYWEGFQTMQAGGKTHTPVPTPTGISMFPGEQLRLSRRWAERRFQRLVHFREADRGGQFAALKAPERLIEDVRDTFRTLR